MWAKLAVGKAYSIVLVLADRKPGVVFTLSFPLQGRCSKVASASSFTPAYLTSAPSPPAITLPSPSIPSPGGASPASITAGCTLLTLG
jgi:hypothetical protein